MLSYFGLAKANAAMVFSGDAAGPQQCRRMVRKLTTQNSDLLNHYSNNSIHLFQYQNHPRSRLNITAGPRTANILQ